MAFSDITAIAGSGPALTVSAEGEVILGGPAFERGLLGFYLRLGLEWAWLQRQPGIAAPVAGLAAARAAALFIQAEMDGLDGDQLPDWVAIMAYEVAPSASVLHAVAAKLPGGAVDKAGLARILENWGLLGTADALMETGGDIRLQRDPLSALNGYGCSHRPRPWAVTFASSTASSSSERGYLAADLERLKTTTSLLAGDPQPVRASLAAVRQGLAEVFLLDPATQVVLAASGTDTELLALALTHLAGNDAPILNILIAPEETGRGVPMAARGVHFAVDTALGHDVAFEAPIEGFRGDTHLANVSLRNADGGLRCIDDVENEINVIIATGIAAGARVILHVLDLSKTGLLAPRPAFLATLRARYGAGFDIVVDACQTRLSAGSINAYLALDAVVLITGSKFFTGPPFAGALLIPAAVASRLAHGSLPAGLDAYFSRDQFPSTCAAASFLPPNGNYGLALRWHAALAEIRAFSLTAPPQRAVILRGFAAIVRESIAANSSLALLNAPAIERSATNDEWETLPSIFSFSMRSPNSSERCLDPAEARAVYIWLNADLSAVLSGEAASRICHVGQPVRLPQPGGDGVMGVLRVSAGARLISGEPSHIGLRGNLRIAREFADLRMVFEKIGLILQNFGRLREANPMPHYRRITGDES